MGKKAQVLVKDAWPVTMSSTKREQGAELSKKTMSSLQAARAHCILETEEGRKGGKVKYIKQPWIKISLDVIVNLEAKVTIQRVGAFGKNTLYSQTERIVI